MALDVKDGQGIDKTLKTTLDGPDHVPHHIVDNPPTGGATENTLAAILAKILAAPSSESKQDIEISALAAILSKIIVAPSTELKQDSIITGIGTLGTQVTLAAILAKIITSPATEAKQDAEITALAGLSTQATSAAILAKLIASPATEAKQDTQVTALGTLATQTTVASILAKIISAPATEAKQDTQITALGTLATQSTAAAILAKIIAAPSTEAKQDTLLAAILPTLSSFRSLTVNSTAQAIKGSAGELWGFNITNLDVNVIYVKIYNIAAASVNPASDVPILTLLVPTIGAVFMEPSARLHVHSSAISVRAVSGSADSNTTAPATLPIIEIKYA